MTIIVIMIVATIRSKSDHDPIGSWLDSDSGQIAVGLQLNRGWTVAGLRLLSDRDRIVIEIRLPTTRVVRMGAQAYSAITHRIRIRKLRNIINYIIFCLFNIIIYLF